MFIVVSVTSDLNLPVQHPNKITLANEIQGSKKPKPALTLAAQFRATPPPISVQIPPEEPVPFDNGHLQHPAGVHLNKILLSNAADLLSWEWLDTESCL